MKRFIWFLTATLVVAGIVAAGQRSQAFEPPIMHMGIGTFVHPIQEPECHRYPCCCCFQPCCCCKDNVHIFGINGLDPLCLGNFNGLCRYLRDQGFENVYFSQLFSSELVCCKIRAIREENPNAQIVLMGYSLGCNYVRCLAHWLKLQDIDIDLLIYLGGDSIWNCRWSCPDNVCRVLNVTSHGLILCGGDLIFKGSDLDCARNHRLHTRHILIPSRQETLELVMEELLALACGPCCCYQPAPGQQAPASPAGPANQLPAPGTAAQARTPAPSRTPAHPDDALLSDTLVTNTLSPAGTLPGPISEQPHDQAPAMPPAPSAGPMQPLNLPAESSD